jgi:hypothetical protein
LRWQHPLDDGGCDITGYKIFRDDGAEGPITTGITFDAGATQYTADPFKFEHQITLGLPFAGLITRFTL